MASLQLSSWSRGTLGRAGVVRLTVVAPGRGIRVRCSVRRGELPYPLCRL